MNLFKMNNKKNIEKPKKKCYKEVPNYIKPKQPFLRERVLKLTAKFLTTKLLQIQF